MKFKSFALAALLSATTLSAMHPDLVGKNPAQINSLYKAKVSALAAAAAPAPEDVAILAALDAAPAHGAGQGQFIGRDRARLGASLKAAHHPVAGSEMDAMLYSMHAGDFTPYIAFKVSKVKKVVSAIVDYLGDVDAANTHVLLQRDAAAVKDSLNAAYDAIVAAAADAVPAPANSRLSTVSTQFGALQMDLDARMNPIIEALSANSNDLIVDAPAMVRAAGLVGALGASSDADIVAASAAFGVLENNQRDTFRDAIKSAIDAIL